MSDAPGSVPAMIAMREIRRTYRLGDTLVGALRGVSIDVARGEFVALMGPSGSGKSTLLHIAGCLDRPDEGSYRFAGEEVATLGEGRLADLRQRRIGFVFQSFHLIARLSAWRNVELPMVFAGVPRGERRARVVRALEAVGLAERMDHRPDQLSGGERQRVAIARAMVMGPELLLADEPTGNLDSKSGGEIVALIRRMVLERGVTVLLVTHDPGVGSLADRIVRMKDGQLLNGGAA